MEYDLFGYLPSWFPPPNRPPNRGVISSWNCQFSLKFIDRPGFSNNFTIDWTVTSSHGIDIAIGWLYMPIDCIYEFSHVFYQTHRHQLQQSIYKLNRKWEISIKSHNIFCESCLRGQILAQTTPNYNTLSGPNAKITMILEFFPKIAICGGVAVDSSQAPISDHHWKSWLTKEFSIYHYKNSQDGMPYHNLTLQCQIFIVYA